MKISRGIEIIKLETSLTPKCAPANTKNALAKKAGSAEIISALVTRAGVIQLVEDPKWCSSLSRLRRTVQSEFAASKDQSLNEWMTTKSIDEEIDEFRD